MFTFNLAKQISRIIICQRLFDFADDLRVEMAQNKLHAVHLTSDYGTEMDIGERTFTVKPC